MIAVIIPTYNEAKNISRLIESIEDLLQKEDFNIIIVDDNSPDGTGNIAEKINQRYGNIIVNIRHEHGLGSAIRDGLKIALSFPNCRYIVTMDADFSHDPNDILRLVNEAENVDIVQGSRYVKGGKIVGWGLGRKIISFTANCLCRSLLRTHIHEHTTYFRVYSRESAEVIVRNAVSEGYEFAVESILIARDHNLRIKEVPIVFIDREQGKSKLRFSTIFKWFSYILHAFLFSTLNVTRFAKFCTVGFFGIIVNVGLLWFLTELIGIFYLISAVFSIEMSIVSNFTLNDLWTFKDRREPSKMNILKRMLKYNTVCVLGLGINIGILYTLTEYVGIYYLASNLFGILAVLLWNYGGSWAWAWKKKSA